ncbi:MAG: hypothetical protein AABZ30_14045 [Myxococcota bacterium]
MPWWRRAGNAAFAAALLAALGASSCAGASATRTLLRESSPIVRSHQQIREELAARDAASGLILKGGCPVCQW